MQTKDSLTVRPTDEIIILRGIAFWLVLIGHSFPDSSYGFSNPYSEFLSDFIQSFHMPLFFIISGFCMNKLLCSEEISIKAELIKRCKRLMLPYCFFSYIAIVPKLLFNSFMYLPFDKSQLWEIFLVRVQAERYGTYGIFLLLIYCISC